MTSFPAIGELPSSVLLGAAHWQILNAALLWCIIAAVAYEYGRARLRRRHPRSPLLSWRKELAFWSAIGLTVVALVSPVDQWAEELFTFHMIQHLILALAAPLLFVLAKPIAMASYGLKPSTRRYVLTTTHHLSVRTGISATSVVVGLTAVAAHVVVFYAWHIPTLYDAAVRNSTLHVFEHLTMFATGLLLWWAVIGVGWYQRSALAVLYLFITGLPMGALAALLTLAPSPLYQSHLQTAGLWNVPPLHDQQLAGGVMWVPGGMLYLGLGVALFVRWLGSGPEPGTTPLGLKA